MSDENDKPASDTLIRLANSCDRAASNKSALGTRMSDLDAEDFKIIARVLRAFASKS